MPIMDGFGATKAIRKTPEISYIPIIIVTALSSIEDKVNSFVYGADDYMNKPINYSGSVASVIWCKIFKLFIDFSIKQLVKESKS